MVFRVVAIGIAVIVAVAPTIGVVVEESADAEASLIQRTRIGIVYRFGPSFGYTTATDNGPSRVQRFRIPDTFAIGASVRVRPQLVLAVEATHIAYSMVERDFVVDQALDAGRVGDFRVDDGTEIHVGAQYTWTRFRALPRLRLGSWFDPNHSVGFRPSEPAATVPDRIFDERLATALSRGTNQVHVTGGLGVTIHRRVELNVGADLAKHQTRVSTSLIVR